ncbi:MAG: TonB-dependent receptor plug domain-containing protein [Kiritimatiellia bacterium]
MVEAGSYDTYQGQASVRAGTKRGFITADAQVYDSEGFSAADEPAGNSEKDGYENTTLGLRGGYQFNESVSLRGSVKHSDHTIEFDAFEFGVGPVDDDGSNLTRGDHTQAMAGMTYDRLEGKQIHDLQLTYYRTNRDTEGTFPASFRGDRKEAEYLMRVEINPALGLLAGANATEETAETNSGIDESNTLYGIFAQVDFLPVEQMILSLTLRNDDHSEFGSQSSWKATSAYSVSDATRLRGSVGTGFRAPSLFELYDSQLGNPDLDPETSISWELGIDQNLWAEKVKAALTYFQLDVTDQIEYVFPTGYSQVEGESNRNGVEVSLTYEPSETLLLQTSYTYMIEAENTSGEDLLRVPEHDVSVSAVASCGDWIFSALLSYVAGVQDLNYRPDGPPVEELDAYWVMGGRMAYQLNAHTEIYLRVENLFDEQYQETRGYGTPDRSAYAGVRLEL